MSPARKLVDPEAILNEIQARYADASQEARALQQDEDDVAIVARAEGEAQAWAAAGKLVQAHLNGAPEATAVEPTRNLCGGTGQTPDPLAHEGWSSAPCPGCEGCAEPTPPTDLDARLDLIHGIAKMRIDDLTEAATPKPIAEAPYGVRMLVFWHGAWHIASITEDCPGCPGESCDRCKGHAGDTWRDANGEIHEGMDEDWPAVYLPLPPAPVSA